MSNGELVTYKTASQIAKAYPTLAEQLEYDKQLKVIRDYMGDHDFYVAELETQVAMAKTLDKGLKAGEISAAGKPKSYKVYNHDGGVAAQVNPNSASLWRAVASIPLKDRQQFYAENSKPSRAALLRWAQPEQAEFEPGEVIEAGKVYDLLLADPPWRYEHSKTRSRKIENQYPTMSLDELCGMSVPAAADCILYLWATAPKLVESIDLIEAWGFEYRSCMVWLKDKVGMGYWARSKHELLLIATAGNPRPPSDRVRPDSVFEATRGKHSAKPACVYEMIERCYPKLSKKELFARNPRKGWDSWGNEV